MRWFERGDIDGFFGLALDNFVQLLLINGLCLGLLGFPSDLLYGRVMPGVAVSLLIGNLFYAWQARRLAEQTGRNDVCALPYGINTVSLFGHVLLVMLPVKTLAEANGMSHAAAANAAWQAGIVACMGSGLIECVGAFVAERIRKATPRAALRATLAGIALTFIALGFLFQTFAHPAVGLTTLAIILLVYFGGVRFKGGIPGGLVAVVIGTAIAWGTGLVGTETAPTGGVHFYAPIPVAGDLIEAFRAGYAWKYLSVIVPMGVFNVMGSLQNIESAEAAGDAYPTRPSLLVNGLGSVAAAIFGSCFPTTIYIGHPGWKALGARAGYSILNGVVMTFICLTGTLAYIAWAVPIDAGMAIVLWIGIVITAQAFQAVPRSHAPAVVLGILPGVAAWGAQMALNGLKAANTFAAGQVPFSEALYEPFRLTSGTWIEGAFALSQGFIFTAMILAAMTVAIIERRFLTAAAWSAVAAVLALLGFIHSFEFVPGKLSVYGELGITLFTPAVPWAIGYACMTVVLVLARFVTVKSEGY